MTALDRPTRADGPALPSGRIPFPVVDEVARHCLQEEEPETVHIEVHLPGRLDRERLRAAFAEALRRHPRILMREAAGHWYRRRYEWELTSEPDVEVVSFPAAGRCALRDARTRALTAAPPLSLSPPIRLEVVEGAGPAEGSEATDAVGESRTAADDRSAGAAPGPTDAAPGPTNAASGPTNATPAPTSTPPDPSSTLPSPTGAATGATSAPPAPNSAPPGPTSTPTSPTSTPPDPNSAPPSPTSTPPDPNSAPPSPTSTPPDPNSAPPGPTSTPPDPPPSGAPGRETRSAQGTGNPRQGAGTVLFLTINHTALDGPACLRVLATAAEIYGGRDNSPAAPPVRAPEVPQDPGDTPSNWSPPARVARGAPEPFPGNGLLVTELPLPHRPKGSPYTVNDQLMVTTALTVAHWNREHGARPRPLRITMPVDDRPRDATMPIGNGTRLVEVPFAPEELAAHGTGDMPALLRRTATRTRALKSLPRPQLGHGAALLTAPVTPVAWRAALTRGLRRAAAPWTSTTLLSNIGRVPYPLDFGADAGRAHAVWFSAPARMPRGLTVTTASTAGRLHLALRWSRALLGHGDGAHLRDLFEHYLHSTEATP
ncbi:hypothetical protein [Streptomyces sediminimaris]|uniref:hypothetical protein n=1 Tax=Streptomyces sediminimaris TaxID=3383721 RepID=UPI00399C0E39